MDVALEGLGPFTALAGRNGAGKTNILEAIDWLAKFATSNAWQFGEHFFFQRDKLMEGEMAFEIDGAYYRYVVSVNSARPSAGEVDIKPTEQLWLVSESGDQQILARSSESVWVGTQEVKIGGRAAAIAALLSVLPADTMYRNELEKVFEFFRSIRYYALDEPSHPETATVIRQPAYAAWLDQYTADQKASDSVLMRLLHIHKTDPEAFEELKDVLGDNDLSVISDIKLQSFMPTRRTKDGGRDSRDSGRDDESQMLYYFFRFLPSQSNYYVEYDDLSLGTRRVLRIITSVMFDHSSVMLMEQPEDSIHSGLMKKVIGFLKQNSNATQIIIASHSPNVFNKMLPEDIRLVHMHNGTTTVRPLNKQELSAAADYVHNDGPLSDFIRIIDDQ
jgi:predicted ATPase